MLGIKPSPLEEQPMILTDEKSLQPLQYFFWGGSVPWTLNIKDWKNFTVFIQYINHKKYTLGAGELAEWLRVLAALPQGLSRVSRTHTEHLSIYL